MKQLRVGFLAFDGVQALDLVGPADAFASDAFHDLYPTVPPYEVVTIGLAGRLFCSSAGINMVAHATIADCGELDTLIVPGGRGLRQPGVANKAAAWIRVREPGIRRIASVCTGLYGLAPTGLLDKREVTTHWSSVGDIKRRFPRLHVDPDPIYVQSGKYYTSAGVTAGIDLALALIEDDLGPEAALAVAREMVVFYKRPGGQRQFSEPLRFQIGSSNRFNQLGAWMHANLDEDLSVENLARRTCLSERHFARAFKEEFGMTPADFVAEARLAEASRRLSVSRRRMNIDAVGRSLGYSGGDVFRRAFERKFGVTPTEYRNRFGT
jgi:transcriptional regulator GlxA family with amidase domain